MKKLIFLVVLAAGLPLAPAQTSPTNRIGIPNPRDMRVVWWREARFGMFIHYGPVSLKGTEISWSRAGERRDRNETITNGIPAAEYDALYQHFNPTNFNAREWVAIAKGAGMKYIVFTAKHHDGFAMFDSQLTDYKLTRSPFGRDLAAELAQACRGAGLHMGFYYSPPDWHHPDFFTTNHARYVKYFHGQVRELLSKYGRVDVLWFDADGGTNTPETWGNQELFPMIRGLQPQILLTKRCGGRGDFDTPEQTIGAFNNTSPWETCMTLCRQWSWKPGDEMKSLSECLRTLISCAGGDGNLLLNVGPMPDGRIEPRQADRLKEMGAWLAQNGESIYGTRGGPFKPGAYGVSTRKGKLIYLHIYNWSENSVTLPPLGQKIVSARLLRGGKAGLQTTDKGIKITTTPAEQDPIDTIVVLELESDALSLPAITRAAF
jgi:alpha-L-fucosidase